MTWKIREQSKKYFDISESKDTTYQNLLDATKLDKEERTELKASERKGIIKIQLEVREIVEKHTENL